MQGRHHRIVSLLWGLSVLGWCALAWGRGEAPAEATRAAVIGLHLVVGLLLLARRPARREGTAGQRARSVPALLVAGCAVALAGPPATWALGVRVAFVAGAALAAVSFLCLGRNFAVLPALREVVARGPYRLVRHPAYVGEGLMVLACCATLAAPLGLALAGAVVALLAVRMRAEEDALRHAPEYAAYCRRVPYRVLPRVW